MWVEVILPLSFDNTFTYSVPPEWEDKVEKGVLVEVEFGKKRHCTALVASIHQELSEEKTYSIKPITSLKNDASVIVTDKQIEFGAWLASYYMCSIGEAYKALVPSGFLTGKTPKRRKTAKVEQTTNQDLNELNSSQQIALTEIQESLLKRDVCLLHGVTSSGKTEIYTHLIAETLAQGKQVLYLLPEIALTTQLTERLKRFFGAKLGVYHSKVTDLERIRIWNNLLKGDGFQIILGVRSSVFLPFKDLGLVIVDEEHEPSYKQQDPAPRYHARNTAIVLAKMHGAKVVLGSATPSIESYYNAQIGKYSYVKLEKRFGTSQLPTIESVDTYDLKRKKKMRGILSPILKEAIKDRLSKGEQVLLYQNRRGFAPAIVCQTCDWTPKCKYCDISLTLHKSRGRDELSCHYCGRIYQAPGICPECSQETLRMMGFGTEKVEDEVREAFPEAVVERMDADTTRTKKMTEELIGRFDNPGEVDILIGTQMLSKGLDFGQVTLVGVLSADGLMNYPDFRSYERAFQQMIQVSGRAGRREEQGQVILQTAHPDHPLIRQILEGDYESMYESQLEERKLFRYPPLCRLIHVNIKYRDEEILNKLANELAQALRMRLGDRVMGPDKPVMGRANKLYLKRILLKIELNASLPALRELLLEVQKTIQSQAQYRYAVIQYDVDPA
ncbi:primosomal protein N' [Bacteroidales bacterium OttesenSCG-928-J19]|nr:primosomal protein N' [Bacteroidales bacterium OttesenSCG-928-J19]